MPVTKVLSACMSWVRMFHIYVMFQHKVLHGRITFQNAYTIQHILPIFTANTLISLEDSETPCSPNLCPYFFDLLQTQWLKQRWNLREASDVVILLPVGPVWLSWLPSVLLPLLPHFHLSSPYCRLQPMVLHRSSTVPSSRAPSMLLLRASALSFLYMQLSLQVSVWLISSCAPCHESNAAFHHLSLSISPAVSEMFTFLVFHRFTHLLHIYTSPA